MALLHGRYGKYDLVKPWSVAPIRLHYENPKPFKQVRARACSAWGHAHACMPCGHALPCTCAHTHTRARIPQAISLVREIEVSHWGNIYVEESYELVGLWLHKLM